MSQIGEDDRLKVFLNALSEAAHSPADHALVADLAEEIGRPDLGVMAAKRASYVGVSLLRAGYPLVSMPRNAGAEQALLLALTRQESAFDLHAVSNAGARGLMQLMPGTAKTVATKMLQLPYKEAKLTDDGTYNVTLGQAYMDSLLATFNGSYLLSIAAYNAGRAGSSSGSTPLAIRAHPMSMRSIGSSSIPFTETRNYVQRVLENLSGLPVAHRQQIAGFLARDGYAPMTETLPSFTDVQAAAGRIGGHAVVYAAARILGTEQTVRASALLGQGRAAAAHRFVQVPGGALPTAWSSSTMRSGRRGVVALLLPATMPRVSQASAEDPGHPGRDRHAGRCARRSSSPITRRASAPRS
ncbi:MAG: lytic transglycosylase domain-containing protein [Aliidongia sp.]